MITQILQQDRNVGYSLEMQTFAMEQARFSTSQIWENSI